METKNEHEKLGNWSEYILRKELFIYDRVFPVTSNDRLFFA